MALSQPIDPSKFPILLGDLESDVSALFQISNTVLLFVSSTFEDTSFEQTALLNYAFPSLRDLCKHRKLNFQVVSMRWGVRNDSGNDHMTSELCMHLLEKCKKDSAGIAYVTIQSHRYGYRPFPSVIEAELFETLKSFQSQLPAMPSFTSPNEGDLLSSPYWLLDEACSPKVYRLQPIDSLPGLGEYLIDDAKKAKMKVDESYRKELLSTQKEAGFRWWAIFARMQAILRGCADLATLAELVSEEQRRPFFISVTHDEVDRGLLRNLNRRTQCLYFERTITGIDEEGLLSSDASNAGIAAAYKDALWAPWGTVPRVKDEETEKLEEALKADLRSPSVSGLDPSSIHLHCVPWVSSSTIDSSLQPLDKKQKREPAEWQAYIQSFCEQFISGVERSVSNLKPRPDPLLQEVLHHRGLVKSKLECVGFDRSSILESIQAYLSPRSRSESDVEGVRPLVLHGSSGTGKSWIMSHAISAARNAYPEAHIVYRLLGTSRSSSDVLELIHSLSRQILFRDEATWSSIPGDWGKAKEWFSSGKVFENLPASTPVFIFLDSLDQLSDVYGPLRDLQGWFPGLKKECALPGHVRVVCSMLPVDQGIDLLSQLRLSLGCGGGCVDSESCGFLEVCPFTAEQALLSLPKMYASLPMRGVICPVRPVMTDAIERLLLELCSYDASALFLSVAIELVSQWPSYVGEARLSQLLLVAKEGGVRGLIGLLFGKLESKHGKLLVGKVLGSMTYCRDGLGREELEDLVSLDEEVLEDVFEWWEPPVRRCPPLLVDRIMFDLDRFVVERGCLGGGVVWGWYHRQFWEVAQLRYGNTKLERDRIFCSISSYFDSDLSVQVPLHPTREERQVDPQRLCVSPSLSLTTPTSGLNVRKLSVLLDSLLQGNSDCQLRLGHLLTNDLSFLMGVLEAGLYQELRVTYHSLINQLNQQTSESHALFLLVKDLKTLSKLMSLCSGVWSQSNDPLRSSKQPPYQIIFRMDAQSLHHPENTLLTQCEEWMKVQTPCIIPVNRRGLLIDVNSPLEMTINISDVTSMCCLLDGRLASGSRDNTVRVWDLSTGECVRVLEGHSHGVTSLCCLPDGRLASGSFDNTVRVWDLSTGECVRVLKGHNDGVTSLCSLPDGRLASNSNRESCFYVWDLSTGECDLKLSAHDSGVTSLCSLPDGRLVFGSEGETTNVSVWDLSTVECVPVDINWSEFCSLPDGRLASGYYDKSVRVWDLSTGECVLVLEGHSEGVRSVCSLPDGRLASGSLDKTVRVWDLSTGECVLVLEGHSETIISLCSLPDGRLASCSKDQTVRVWDLSTVKSVRGLKEHSGTIISLCSLYDGRLASSSRDKTVRVWDLPSGECVRVLEGHSEGVTSLCSLPDGRLASGSSDETVRVWDLSTGECVRVLEDHSYSVTSLCSLPDGRLASGIHNSIFVWNLSTGKCVLKVDSSGAHFSLCSLPDGRLASSCSENKKFSVWDLSTGECVRYFGRNSVTSMCSLPDGRLISGSRDKTIHVWDLSSGECVLFGRNGVTSLCSLPDGRLALGSSDNTVNVWDLSTGECVRVLEGKNDVSVFEGSSFISFVSYFLEGFDGISLNSKFTLRSMTTIPNSQDVIFTLVLPNHQLSFWRIPTTSDVSSQPSSTSLAQTLLSLLLNATKDQEKIEEVKALVTFEEAQVERREKKYQISNFLYIC